MTSRLDLVMSIKNLPAPTREDQQFHRMNLAYAEQSIDNGVKDDILTERDAALIEEYTMELRAAKSVSVPCHEDYLDPRELATIPENSICRVHGYRSISRNRGDEGSAAMWKAVQTEYPA